MGAQLQVVTTNEYPEIQADFDAFWTLYPRRVAKKDATKAWAQIHPREHVEILTALTAWRRVWLARGDLEFVPYPASWLRGERWTDELPRQSTVSHAGHIPFESKPDAFVKGEMPDSVKAAIRKLRGGA